MKYRKLSQSEQKERADILRSGANYSGKDQENYSFFSGMTPATARVLLEKGYADPEDCQNGSPSFLEMTEFCEKHPGFTMHGYVIGSDRDDARVTAEGVQGTAQDAEGMLDFFETFRCADSCDTDRETRSCYCWYD